ncbi:MAG: DUF1778 domain-containing protein [Verrucomicrobiales bacterium]|nr:DUF1778 domain-containing protein [Verrucomicrobiales bacterium]
MKTVRQAARLSAEQKQSIELAASYQGVSQIDFVLSTVQDEARWLVEDHGAIELTVEQSAKVAVALADPPEPAGALLEAFVAYKKKISG